ncbi:MAG TPA: PGPGW domain-containing protein [Micromonosporaceae bacterium]|nr:PGPGW domain-containing protein [Micromonosporaceae bacterium]
MRDQTTDDDRAQPAEPRPPRLPRPLARAWDSLLRMRRRMYGTRAGRLTVRISIAVVGALIVGLGLLMVPLPGPGWLVVLAGLGIWSLEFRWARSLLALTRRGLSWWSRTMRSGPWLARIALGAVLATAILGAAWLSLRYTFDVDVTELLRADVKSS